jgi:trehalose utilization protein
MSQKIRATVWNEFRHERNDEKVRQVYPEGIHHAIADFLSQQPDMQVRTATLDEPEHGLSEAVLETTDVLLWWGHQAHTEVSDDVVVRVHQRVLSGMGLIVLHSAHESKIFKAQMGTGCSLKWREAGERERLWCIEPEHPIATGLDEFIDLPHTEMYGERFDIPAPDEVVFISWFEGGEVFRSGCTFHRSNGKIFYFRPGHETYPIYANKQVQQVIQNAIRWAWNG